MICGLLPTQPGESATADPACPDCVTRLQNLAMNPNLPTRSSVDSATGMIRIEIVTHEQAPSKCVRPD